MHASVSLVRMRPRALAPNRCSPSYLLLCILLSISITLLISLRISNFGPLSFDVCLALIVHSPRVFFFNILFVVALRIDKQLGIGAMASYKLPSGRRPHDAHRQQLPSAVYKRLRHQNPAALCTCYSFFML